VAEHPPIDVAAAVPNLRRRGGLPAIVGDDVLAVPGAMIQRLWVLAQTPRDETGIAQTDGQNGRLVLTIDSGVPPNGPIGALTAARTST
jgi:hypothetical protein